MSVDIDRGTLLARWEVGSRAYGTATVDSDRDFAEVRVEPPACITGLRTYRTRQDNAKGGDHDDLAMYGLRTWADLVAAGNPNMVETLFLDTIDAAPAWQSVLAARAAFLSRNAGRKFLGYGRSQISALAGTRNKNTNRPELEHRYGFDTKFAYHAIRILSEGINLLTDGSLAFPLPNADALTAIRTGALTKVEVIDHANDLANDLAVLVAAPDGPLAEYPDYDRINDLLHGIYTAAWRA